MRGAFLFISFFAILLSAVAQNSPGKINTISYIQDDSAGIIETWLDQAVAFSSSDSTQAELYFFKAIRAAQRNKNRRLQADAQMKFAAFHFAEGSMHRSFGNYLEAKNIYTDLNAPSELARATFGLAKTQFYRGNYRNSLRMFVEAYALAEQLQLKDIESEASEWLGLLYNSTQNFSAGISYFLRSLDIKNKIGDEKGIIRMANKLSEMYYDRRKFDSASYYASIAVEGAEAMGLTTDIYNARLAKVSALIRLHRWEDAKREFIPLDAIHASHKRDVNFFVRYNITKGNYYLSQQDKEKSRIHYDTALSSARRNRFPEMYALIYKNMAETYYELGDFKTAVDYYQQYNYALGELMSGENARMLGNMETLMNVDKSKDEITLLNTENKLKQLQLVRELEMRNALERQNALMDSIILQQKTLGKALARENDYKSGQLANEKKLRSAELAKLADEKNLRWSLMAGLAAVLVLGSVIFYQYKRQQKKRLIIEKQSDELQTLMKEIHHRVKNNLQIISSLLDLQSLTIKDSQAAEAVKEGKNRVQSMALIHQNLYNEGNIKGIRMESYIHNLADSLFHSYNIQPEKIKMRTDIEELNLDVDTVIPIGLIINELVSNSLKYAFTNAEEGEIYVELKKQRDQSLLLKVKDNGKGFPEGAGISNPGSFGMKMINAFAQKLKAKLDIYNDNGATVVMHINRYKTA